MSSPTPPSRALLRKIQSFNKNRQFRVAVLGQNGVGKSALTVRFITRRFIGEYDSTLGEQIIEHAPSACFPQQLEITLQIGAECDSEKTYTCTRSVMGTTVDFEILDTAEQYENSRLKQAIKWSDAVILMYSVADRCSLEEARRLSFTITVSSRRRNKPGSDPCQEFSLVTGVPVMLVANQADRHHDRMVSTEEGHRMATELGCLAFAEISVREDVDSVMEVFEDLFASSRKLHKVKAQSGHAGWSVVSLERLTLGHSGRERLDSGGGGGGEEEEGSYNDRGPTSPGARNRRREALIS